MPKVLISDKMSPQAVDMFKQKGVEVDVKTNLTPDELKACIGEYDGLAVRSSTKATKEIIEAAKNLKVIGRAGIGIDNVDVAAATAKGIVVMNTPFGNSVTTAEHAISLMMSLARQIPEANASTHAGKWEKSKFMGVEITGKTLGLIGCGNIGSIVANRAQGLKMKVMVYDPFLTNEKAVDLNVTKVELEDLLKKADFISLHTPLTEGTRNILSRENMAKTKKGVRIINCARGGLIDEQALHDALVSGHVAGAALDVFAEEPAKANPLFGLENVICTPHLGASTSEAQENVAIQVAEQMAAYLTEGSVVNAVNVPSVSAEDAAKLGPYLQLGDYLGTLAGQLASSAIKLIKIEYEGSVSKLNIKPITATILKGVLSPLVESVNMINAPIVAKERNMSVSETLNDRQQDYKTLIRITLQTEKQMLSVAGTLFGGTKPRLTQFNDTQLEVCFSQNMIFIRNEDKPGLIGEIGRILGASNINIGNFNLGRNFDTKEATALVEVDQAVPTDIIDSIKNLPVFKQVQLLHFNI
ncbi:MAG: phosphoglycerate dehydrogenase [Alphaproteobacteria bacterium]|nr:phosphoglycerate dehydrogenase [Alphaproteobacteria bacterium]